jgi:hypothetical protein
VTAPVQGLAEAQAAAVAFQLALTKLGLKSIAAALQAWKSVPANKAAEVADEYMNTAVRQIMGQRVIAQDLAVAYYRLARALRTGTTIPDPRRPIPATVTMAELREEFARAVEVAARGAERLPPAPAPASPTEDTPETAQDDSAGSDTEGQEPEVLPEPDPEPTPEMKSDVPDDTEIEIDELDGDDDELDEIEEAAEQEIRVVLKALGPSALTKAVEQIDDEQPARVVDAQRDKAKAKTGARQAAASSRIARNGARGTMHSLQRRDRKAIGFVRVSRTGTPCGFCAMLISRGIIFYSSQATAEGKTQRAKTVRDGTAAEGDAYHDNCNCYAEAVYSREEYRNDPLYALNREYDRLWPIVTKNKFGKEAESVWRRYWRDQQKTKKKSARVA